MRPAPRPPLLTRTVTWTATLAVLVSTACGTRPRTGAPQTQREADSVLGQSKIPGATGVRKALDVSDSGAARARALDSAARNP